MPKKGGKLPNWRRFGVIATSKSFFMKKKIHIWIPRTISDNIFFYDYFPSIVFWAPNLHFFIDQKGKKLPNWRLYDVKKNSDEIIYTFFGFLAKFPKKNFLTIFSRITYFGLKIEKSVFLAFSLYSLYKMPIKCWFSKKLFATHFPSSQIFQKFPY